MSRLLIKAQDAIHADPVTDKRGCYKRGDVVVVKPDGHVWGGAEGLPTFLQLDIPSLSEGDLAYLANEEQQQPNEFTSVALRRVKKLFSKVSKLRERETTRRRGYSLDLTGINFVDGVATISSPAAINKRRL